MNWSKGLGKMLNVGIGLTSKCNCNCEHCYSRIYGNNSFLNKNLLYTFFENFSIESVNFGTGESFFHPDYIEIIHYLSAKSIHVSVTTNGYTVSKMTDQELLLLHDVDFSLDYPVKELHDANRQSGCYNSVQSGIERCKRLGIICSIAWCLTPDNSRYIREMFHLCRQWGVFLRINIYKPVEDRKGFTFRQFWHSINEIFKWGDIVSVSESIVNAALGNSRGLSGCNPGNVRIFPDGSMSSCVYVQNKLMTIQDACRLSEKELLKYFDTQYELSENSPCRQCNVLEVCKGGCMARRKIAGLDFDEFCFKRGKDIPRFERVVYSSSSSEMFVHSSYICTLIMEPRGDI